jgi:hypothetical protein
MKTIIKYLVAALLTAGSIKVQAQYCQNPIDTIYSLTAAGQLYPVNVNNALAGPAFGSTGTGVNANGLGFSSLNGSFYFFNRCNTGVTGDTIQFVRYIPSTHATQVLADPPLTFTVADKIRSGCLNNAGSGYYTINPAATGGPALYYYSVGTNTWVTVTQTFKNKSGGTIANITTLNSGDMTFDGGGNLWMVCSNSASYTLYKIKAPVPVVFTTSILIDTIIIPKATPGGVSITGIAFNATGKLYLSTGAGVGAGNNKLYELATSTGSLTLKGTLPAGYGDDLTSCSFPFGVLPVVWVNFTARFQTNAVHLAWTANEKDNVTGYNVEYSKDEEHWSTIAYIKKNENGSGSLQAYSHIHEQFIAGNNYYRVVQLSSTGPSVNSVVKAVNTGDGRKIYIGPNPAKNTLYIYNRNNYSKYLAQICDQDGRLVYSTALEQGQASISIEQLPKGVYLLKLASVVINEAPASYKFIKW